MPFANTSNIQALHLGNYFKSSGGFPINNYYRGKYNATLDRDLVPNCGENSAVPTSGQISYATLAGKYAANVVNWSVTAGTYASLTGYDSTLSMGSLGPSDTYQAGSGAAIKITGLYQESGSIYLSLASGSSFNGASNTNIFQATFSVNGGNSLTFTIANRASGSNPSSSHTYFTNFSNTAFTSGNSYPIRMMWIY